MNLEQRVMTDLKTAMLAKDEAALRSLRAIKASIILAKTCRRRQRLDQRRRRNQNPSETD